MTPCPAHIARHTIRKGFAPDAPANAADRRTYSSALPAGAVTPQRRAWQSSLLHDARHSRAFFMPGRSAQLLAAVPRVPGRQQRTETIRRRAAAIQRRARKQRRRRHPPSRRTAQSQGGRRRDREKKRGRQPPSRRTAQKRRRAAAAPLSDSVAQRGPPGALRGNGENAAPIHGATGSKGGAGNRPRAARHKPAAPGARAVKRQRGDAPGAAEGGGSPGAARRHWQAPSA